MRHAFADAQARARDIGSALLLAPVTEVAARAGVELPALRGEAATTASADAPPVADLTPREREVLELVIAGATNRQIGSRLFISEKTASVHVSRILTKLGVTSRQEAASAGRRALRAAERSPTP